MRIGILRSIIRVVETTYDVILERCVNHSRALHRLAVLNSHEVRTVNSYQVANTCGDQLLISNNLIANGDPTPRTLIAYTPESALEAIEELGYPVAL